MKEIACVVKSVVLDKAAVSTGTRGPGLFIDGVVCLNCVLLLFPQLSQGNTDVVTRRGGGGGGGGDIPVQPEPRD